jgi:hypothetical protein
MLKTRLMYQFVGHAKHWGLPGAVITMYQEKNPVKKY